MRRVALIGENSVEYINILLGIWANGDSAVLVDWRMPFKKYAELLQEADVKQCYIEKKLLVQTSGSYNGGINFLTFERSSQSAMELPYEIYDKYIESYDKSEAVVFYSSGTTGKAKGIILSHYAISTNADAVIDYMELKNTDCIYIVKAFSHSSTLTGELLVALKKRAKLVIAPSIVTPRQVFADINRYGVTILCLNPTLLEIYARNYFEKACIINSLHTIYVSGSILHEKVYNLARDSFKGIEILNMYGLTEAGPRVTVQKEMGGCDNCVGQAIRNVELAIVDPHGNAVGQGGRGMIYVNTPSCFEGYITNEEEREPLYKGWLCTGDIGYFDSDGCLHVVGRMDNMISSNAHNVFPEEVEWVIKSYEDVKDCVVFGSSGSMGEDMLICHYVTYSGEQIADDLRKLCLQELAVYEVPAKFIRVNQILYNANNKLSRPIAWESGGEK